MNTFLDQSAKRFDDFMKGEGDGPTDLKGFLRKEQIAAMLKIVEDLQEYERGGETEVITRSHLAILHKSLEEKELCFHNTHPNGSCDVSNYSQEKHPTFCTASVKEPAYMHHHDCPVRSQEKPEWEEQFEDFVSINELYQRGVNVGKLKAFITSATASEFERGKQAGRDEEAKGYAEGYAVGAKIAYLLNPTNQELAHCASCNKELPGIPASYAQRNPDGWVKCMECYNKEKSEWERELLGYASDIGADVYNKIKSIITSATATARFKGKMEEAERQDELIGERYQQGIQMGITTALNLITGDEYREIRHKIKEKYLDHNGTSN